jgi:hypothetical protein
MINRLSLFYDISGRISEGSQLNPFFTIGGVIIPTEDEDKVRVALGYGIPKWRDANGVSLSLITSVLNHYDIYCTVARIEKTEPAWTEFWSTGDRQYQYLSSKTKPKPGFAKPGNVLKDWAFGICSAAGLGLYLRSQGRPVILDPNGLSALYLKVVCDTEIQGEENRKVFEDSWTHWCEVTKLAPHLEIKPYIDCVQFKTEQEENLLILPDYLAGYINYSSDTKHVSLPVNLSRKDAEMFGQALSGSIRFNLIEYPFDEVFPNLTR